MPLNRETPTELRVKPSKEPISTSEMKTHLRQDLSAEDSLIDNLIKTARQKVENFTNRVLIEQEWSVYLQDFPSLEWQEIPKPPLVSVDTFDYTTEDDTTSTFNSSNYRVDTHREPGLIQLKTDTDWPDPSKDLKTRNPVEIQFTAGYGTSRDDVPEEIQSAMKLMVSHWYEHRKEVELNKIVRRIPAGAKSLLWPYRVQVFAK